jgi:hypothetical protein
MFLFLFTARSAGRAMPRAVSEKEKDQENEND